MSPGQLKRLLAALVTVVATSAVSGVLLPEVQASPQPAATSESATEEGVLRSSQLDRLNKMLIREAELQVQQARRERDRAWRLYNLYKNLAEKDLVSGKDLGSALEAYEDADLQVKQADVDLEKTKLDLLRTAIHITIVDAKKFRTEEGELKAEITLMNNSNLPRAMAVEESVSKAEATELLTVESLVVSLKDEAIVSFPYEAVIPSLVLGESRTLEFRLLEDIENVYVSLRYFDTEELKRVTFRKESTRRFPRIGSSQFSQEGELGTAVEYDISLELLTREEKTFHLRVLGLPSEVKTHFSALPPPGHKFGPRITQVKFSDASSKADVTLQVAIPKSLNKEQIDQRIKFYAVITDTAGLQRMTELEESSGDEPLDEDALMAADAGYVSLELLPRGVGKLDIIIPNRYQQITLGQLVNMSLEVRNTGTIAIDNVQFDSFMPLRWGVTLEPEFVKTLGPGQEQRIDLTIEPGSNTVVGEYDVRLIARGEVGSTETESEEKALSIRIDPKAKFLGPALLVGVILLLMVAIAAITIKVSRR